MSKQEEIKQILENESSNAVAMLTTLFEFPLTRTYHKISDTKGTMVIDLRGWGYLTGKGHGALGLDQDTATKVQDRFGDELVTLLNKINELAD